jgi:multiple sugar transport system permease protein
MAEGPMEHRVGETYWKRLVVFYIPLFMFLVVVLFPFYWMAIASVKPDQELYNVRMSPFLVRDPTVSHWVYLFTETLFARWMVNTFVIATASTVLSLACGVLAGYSLSRLRYPGSTGIGVSIFVTYLVPPTLLFIPLADVIANLRLLDTPWALILSYPTILVPFCTWLLMGYFKTIPKELEECARIDGATRFQAFYRIILPLAVPGVLSAGIFAFTLSWNEFLFALVFLSSPENKTVPVGVVSELIKGDVFFWGALMAGGLFGSIPVAIVYSFFVEYYVAGLTGGAVKG